MPVDVNEVAAESQRKAALSEHDNLEPGSNLWIARQAYLKLTEDALREKKQQIWATYKKTIKLCSKLFF